MKNLFTSLLLCCVLSVLAVGQNSNNDKTLKPIEQETSAQYNTFERSGGQDIARGGDFKNGAQFVYLIGGALGLFSLSDEIDYRAQDGMRYTSGLLGIIGWTLNIYGNMQISKGGRKLDKEMRK